MQELLFVPMVLFLTIVAPIWLTLHYRFKTKMTRGLSENEHGSIDTMLESLDKLAERIDTLESILDSEHPNWRNQSKEGRTHE